MNKRTDHIGSLAKGLRVLEAFGGGVEQLSIADAAAATGLDRATARRCLLTLHHEGYATYDGKFFGLTTRALRLGMSVLDSLPLPRLVQPWLDQLTEVIGQSCSIAVLDGTEIVYLARATQRRVMSIGLMPGSRLPASCTSMGRVLLSALPEADAKAVLEATDMTPRTVHSLTDRAAIIEELVRVREQGFCLVDQEIELGLRSLAVPIFDARGEVVAALNTGLAAVHRQASDIVTQYLPALQRVQAGLRPNL